MLLGEKVKEAIQEAGLTTEDVAYNIEMSANNLYRLYKKDSFEIKYLIKISELVKKPLSYFLTEMLDEKSVYQIGGSGNAGRDIKKQKNINGQTENIANPISGKNIAELEYKLNLCESKQESLIALLETKEKYISLLEKNQK